MTLSVCAGFVHGPIHWGLRLGQTNFPSAVMPFFATLTDSPPSGLFFIRSHMGWDEIYRGMAFQAYSHGFAVTAELRGALTVLHGFLQGQSRSYEVLEALRFLEYRFTETKGPCMVIRRCLGVDAEDEEARDVLVREAIQIIEKLTTRKHPGDHDLDDVGMRG